jgi:energy-coupling factor transport system ATP-binding protein
MKNQEIKVSNESKNIIISKDLKIIFDEHTDEETLVLQNFTYNFNKNKIFFIIGNSGTGKTTLVTHFNGLLKSKYGDIYINDIPILAKQRKIKKFKELRKNVGMVLQFPEYQLFKDTVEKDIMFGPINLGVKKPEAKLRAKKYLNKLGLADKFLLHSPFELSGGQKRRVALAGILAIEPQILIFDEPSAGLDPAGEQEIIKIIRDLKTDGKTIIVITHVMDQVLTLADEVIVLDKQKIVASGTPYQIFTNKELIQATKLDTPKIIKVIFQLIEKDKRFEELLTIQPRTIQELSNAIINIINKVKHE